MDFSRVGYVHSLPDAFRARAQWKDFGRPRECYGPRRPDEETAQRDLESMRAAASGMGREEGFAALAAEANRLKEGKAPKEQGCVEEFDGGYRADMRWYEGGSQRHAHGPRRSEKRRAEEDLEALREASSNHADSAVRRAALVAEAHRLQQLAEREVHVSIAARGLAQQQREQHPIARQQHHQPSVDRHPVEDGSGSDSQSDWEIGEADDADVVYAWERFDDRGRSLDQTPVAPSVTLPDPKNPDEATAMLAKFRPIRSTPEDLQRLLEARADPNMTVGEGSISPMENIMTFAREIHVPIIFHEGPYGPILAPEPHGSYPPVYIR